MTVLLYGYGYWGSKVASAFRRAGHAVVVHDMSPESDKRAARDGFAVAPNGPRPANAVAICTPPETHVRLIRDALAVGLHVWTEKPAGANAAEVHDLALAAFRAGRVLFLDYTFAYAPAVEVLAQHVGDDLRHVTGIRAHLARFTDDAIGDLLPHDLSILWTCGRSPVAVSCCQGADGADAHVLLTLDNGARASLLLSRSAGIKLRTMTFFSDRRTVVYDHLDPRAPVRVYRAEDGDAGRDAFGYGPLLCPVVSPSEPLTRAVDAFAREVAQAATFNQQAVEAQCVLDAARASAKRDGEWIKIRSGP